MKKILLSLFLLFFCTNLLQAENIDGFWKVIDQSTGIPKCLVAIYEYQNKYYGRIVGTYNKEGVMTQTLDNPEDRAAGINGKPFYCGLDMLWDLKKGSRCKGKIVDPRKGNVYNAELWVKNGKLIVRGKVLCFGRNQTWLPASDDDFPSTFKQPDVSEFVPVIPQVN